MRGNTHAPKTPTSTPTPTPHPRPPTFTPQPLLPTPDPAPRPCLSSQTSLESAKATTVVSPSKGCDLSPGFHLSAPWSPPPRRGVPRRNSRGNRPRTFSEYSAGPSSSGGLSSSPPLTHRGRTVSVASGLAAALNSGMTDSGGGGVDGVYQNIEPRFMQIYNKNVWHMVVHAAI